jgi:nicotinamide mononucleotide transporter
VDEKKKPPLVSFLMHTPGKSYLCAMNPDVAIEIGAVRTTLVELIAVAFGLASVWAMKKESILAFPFGIVNVLIYVYICIIAGLYAYAGINLFYFMMSVYGWFTWSAKGTGKEVIRITRCSGKGLLFNGLAIALFFVILYLLLTRLTDSTVPVWDSLTTAIYILAMWLLARKKIENWILWIAGDVISIALFASEQLYFSSLQFLVFTVIAIFGFSEWKRKLRHA